MARINEHFFSTQGEGKWTGVPTQFIRFYGCNLDCSWCDQPNALETRNSGRQHYSEYSPEEVAQIICQHDISVPVCFTGGEPLMQWQDLLQVIKCVDEIDTRHQSNFRPLTMESNSTIFVPDLAQREVFLSSSPKFQGVMLDQVPEAYGEKEVLKWVSSSTPMQLKFVVENEDWFERILKWLGKVPKERRYSIPLYFQPEYFKGQDAFQKIIKKWVTTEKWPELVALGFQEVRFGVQQHKILHVR